MPCVTVDTPYIVHYILQCKRDKIHPQLWLDSCLINIFPKLCDIMPCLVSHLASTLEKKNAFGNENTANRGLTAIFTEDKPISPANFCNVQCGPSWCSSSFFWPPGHPQPNWTGQKPDLSPERYSFSENQWLDVVEEGCITVPPAGKGNRIQCYVFQLVARSWPLSLRVLACLY